MKNNKVLGSVLMVGIFSLSAIAISEFSELGESYINYSKVRPSMILEGEYVRDVKHAGYRGEETMKPAATKAKNVIISNDTVVETMKYRDTSKGRTLVGDGGKYTDRVGNVDYVRHISNINKVKAYKLERGEAPSTFAENVLKRLNILKWIRGKQLESNKGVIGDVDKKSKDVFGN
jgi:hypothetical protein